MGVIHGGIAIFDTGCDWLTVTAGRGTEDADVLRKVGQQALRCAVEEGHSSRESNVQGYAGVMVEGAFYGARHDGYILQGRSDTAKTIATELARNNFDGHVTRMDVQVTVQHPEDDLERAYRYHQHLRATTVEHKGVGNLRLALLERGERGALLQLGARQSMRFGRGYDKSREQKNQVPPRLWRWEWEYKQERAGNLWKAFKLAAHPKYLSVSCVVGELMSVGIEEDWMKGTEIHEHPSCWHATDSARRLRWLANDVRHTVGLCVEDGFEREVYDALGLEKPSRLQLPLPGVVDMVPRPDKDKIERQLAAMSRADDVRLAQWRREHSK